MPSVAPASFEKRAGHVQEPLPYEMSWMAVPFDDYEGMTQQQFQDSVAPFSNHGKKVNVDVPKGWRRMEGGQPGKHFYVHMGTGAICKFPKELYDCKKESWITKDGIKITEAELNVHPEQRIMKLAYPDKVPAGGKPLEAAAPKPALPAPEKAAPEKPAIADAEAKPKPEPTPEPAVVEVPPELAAPSEPPLPVALLFPGQGSQYVKMLSGVKDKPAVKRLLETAERILGYDILELCLKGPESKLEQTRYCQPAMYIGGMAAVEKLREDKPDRIERCQAVAGLSLGEYTALTVAEVFDFETGLQIVKLRAEAMQEAAEASEQSMLSVAGLDQETLGALCKESRTSDGDVCEIANFLFPNGFSCAGTRSSVEKLMQKAQKTDGCLQAKLLKTSGGFHTSLMSPARDKLIKFLRSQEGKMKPPKCDVYMNLSGRRITPAAKPADIIPMLGDQLCNCVQWEPSMKEMIKDGVTEFYECGPMKQLKAMMKRIDPNAFKGTTTIDV